MIFDIDVLTFLYGSADVYLLSPILEPKLQNQKSKNINVKYHFIL